MNIDINVYFVLGNPLFLVFGIKKHEQYTLTLKLR